MFNPSTDHDIVMDFLGGMALQYVFYRDNVASARTDLSHLLTGYVQGVSAFIFRHDCPLPVI